MTELVRKLKAAGVELSEDEERMIRVGGLTTADELYASCVAFPSLAKLGINLAKLSGTALRLSSQAVQAAASTGSVPPPTFLKGAEHPAGAPSPDGTQISGGAPPGSSGGSGGFSPKTIDYRIKGWTIRDQGHRGTCVAHALVACREHLACPNGKPVTDLSEQFLFWAIKTKTKDPNSSIDGTLLDYGKEALGLTGVCEESDWTYNGQVKPGNITHAKNGVPSPPIQQNALNYRHSTRIYVHNTSSSGSAKVVYSALVNEQRPVAVTVPVFRDIQNGQSDNWNTVLGKMYGVVLDPQLSSIAEGGHAVCITGFVPDGQELLGGYFIFRNSWGIKRWSIQAPAQHVPEVGYGRISASYIDAHLWEMCIL